MSAQTGPGPNDAQQRFWSEGPGRHWVRLHRELDVLHARLTDIILDAAAPQTGERVVDIGCGAGAVAIAAAQRVGRSGHVLGLDISEPLLEVGRDRAAELDTCAPDFALADAQIWAHEGAPFDLCVSRMGLMFFADPVAGFANILTHLRPGGRLVFAAWAAAEHNAWFHVASEEAAARLGPSEPGDPHAPGPTAFADRARVADLLARVGATEIGSREIDTTLTMPGGAAEAAALARHVGPVAAQLRAKEGSDEDAQAILAAVERRFAQWEDARGCHIPARINLFHAIRP